MGKFVLFLLTTCLLILVSPPTNGRLHSTATADDDENSEDMEGWMMRAHAKGIRMATDLVVLGAGAPDQPDLGLGATTEQVVAQADCSVLVVRPLR